jgi:hypothetical protein
MANTKSSSSAGLSLSPAGKVTFKVPKAYWEHFRAGVVFDLAFDSKSIVEQCLTGYKQRIWGYKPNHRGHIDLRGEEHTGPLGYLARTAVLLSELEDACPAAKEPERDIAITGDPESLMYSLHALANRIAGPMLTEALDGDLGSPNPEAREWSAVATWAMDSMEALEPARLAATKLRAEESKEAKS